MLMVVRMAAQTDDVHTTQGVYMNNQASYQCTSDLNGDGWSGRVNAGPSYPAPSEFLVTNATPGATNAPNTVESAPDTGVLLGTKTYGSPMLQCGLTQAQFKIGSAQFPATAIRLDSVSRSSSSRALLPRVGVSRSSSRCIAASQSVTRSATA